MFKQVVISGAAAIGFAETRDGWRKLQPATGLSWRDCDPQEVQNVLTLLPGAIMRDALESDTERSLELEVDAAIASHRAFFYLLASVDPDLSESLRIEAMRLAESYLDSKPLLFEYCAQRLISSAPPEDALWAEGLALSTLHRFNWVCKLHRMMNFCKAEIAFIAVCWEALAVPPHGQASKQFLWKQLVQQAYFSKVLVLIQISGSKAELASAFKTLEASLIFPQEFPIGFDFGKSVAAYHTILAGEFKPEKNKLLDQPKKYYFLGMRSNPKEQKIAPVCYAKRFNLRSANRLEKTPMFRFAKYKPDKANTFGSLRDMHLVGSSHESSPKSIAKRKYRLVISKKSK
jgi:hypothetical protein